VIGIGILVLIFGLVAVVASDFDVWALAWFTWAALFVIVEGLALINGNEGEKDTLSQKIRSWTGLDGTKRSLLSWILLVALILFFIWFPLHILTGVV
jgi:hypothetical protein